MYKIRPKGEMSNQGKRVWLNLYGANNLFISIPHNFFLKYYLWLIGLYKYANSEEERHYVHLNYMHFECTLKMYLQLQNIGITTFKIFPFRCFINNATFHNLTNILNIISKYNF